MQPMAATQAGEQRVLDFRTLDPNLLSSVRGLAMIASLAVVLVALIVLVGWTGDVPALTTIHPAWVTMKPNAALAFLLGGASLGLSLGRRGRSLGRFLGASVLLIGALTLAEYAFDLNFRIDEVLLKGHSTLPIRMAPNTAVCLVLLGSALTFVEAAPRLATPNQLLAVIAGVVALLALHGYVYGVSPLYRVASYTQMALPAAFNFVALAFGILAARPDRGLMAVFTNDAAGGVLSRRLLPVVVLAPLILGWLERQGEHAALFDPPLGLSLVIVSMVVLLSSVVLWNGHLLARTDMAHREAAKALEKTHARLDRLAESGIVGITVADFEGRFKETNEAFRKMVGYGREELLGGSLREEDLMPSELRAIDHEELAKLKACGALPLREKVYLRKGGERASVLVGRAVLEGNESISFIADISESKRVEDELRQSEARYRTLVESSPVPNWLYDRETLRFLEVNDATVRCYGYSRQELLGMTIDDVSLPEDVERMTADGALAAQETVKWGILKQRRKDGTILDMDVTAHALTLAGRPVVLAVAQEVTEKRRLEAQLLQSQKMEAVGRLAGGVAHDFNNILAVILSYAEAALMTLGEEHEAAKDIVEVSAAAQRAAALTRQLLAFSRRQVLQPRVLAVNELLSGLETLLRRTISEDIELCTILDPRVGSIKADPGQVEQVFLNLVVNARDAMPSGGKLTIETKSVELDDVHAPQIGVARGRYVLLAVSDTGCGMPADVVAHIFEPFFTTKEVGKGTGLGLSTVFGIVQQAGGGVSVYSEPGRGTTFKVYLPRVDAAIAEAPAAPRAPIQRGSETIVVVEDDEQVRRVVGRVLVGHGYRVLEAENARAAMDLLRTHDGHVQLLVTDLVMPDMDGLTMATRVLERSPGMRVLFMSGYTEHAALRGNALGPGDRFIQKPFTAQEMLFAVRDLLDGAG